MNGPRDIAYAAHLHIATLRSRGWTIRSISAHANTSPSDVSRLARTGQTSNYSCAAGILAIDPNTRASKTAGKYREPNVSRVGTVRRIQALLAIGWPHDEITCRLNEAGVTDVRASVNLLHAPGSLVRRSRHDAVAQVYRDLLAIGDGPSAKARTYANRLGYVVPGRWDDIDNDLEPEQAPEAHGARRGYELLEDFAHLVSQGESRDQAARRLGVTLDAIEKATERGAAA